MADLTGQRFGSLLVTERLYVSSGQRIYRCLCDCGQEHHARSGNLQAGRTSRCSACRYKHNGASRNGEKTSRLYYIWDSMRRRCQKPDDPAYPNYGGRGISFCDEWNDFGAFHEWAVANGYEPHLTLDRIDNDGNYEPGNCRWTTEKVQARNSRANQMVTYQGQTKCLMEWSEVMGIPYGTLHARLFRYGWSVRRAFTERLPRWARAEGGF